MKTYSKESAFQHDLKEEIEERLPGAIVLKNDPTFVQGIPDLIILYEDKWAALEVKRSEADMKAAMRGHGRKQKYYVEMMDAMSFASFIFPENKEEVLYDMERTLKRRTRRSARHTRS